MYKSKNIELIEIINPNIINDLDFLLPLSLGIFLEEDNLLSFFILERLDNDLFTTKIKYLVIKLKS